MKKQNRSVKTAAVLLAFCVAFIMMYFLLYTATHEIHDCTGAGCPVCHELQLAQSIIKQFGTAGRIAAAAFFFLAFCKKADAAIFCSIPERTLISDKVRMDH